MGQAEVILEAEALSHVQGSGLGHVQGVGGEWEQGVVLKVADELVPGAEPCTGHGPAACVRGVGRSGS